MYKDPVTSRTILCTMLLNIYNNQKLMSCLNISYDSIAKPLRCGGILLHIVTA